MARSLLSDKLAVCAALFLILVALFAYGVAPMLGPEAMQQQLLSRMHAPFQFRYGIRDFLGTDALGRSTLFRMIVAAQTSLTIAICTVAIAATLGTMIGIYAGLCRGVIDAIAMRLADVILSFPLLLLAILFLYLLEPSIVNIIVLLVVGRLPLYLRVSRAEALEVSRRLFVDAARLQGASRWWLCFREIGPVVAPTTLTLAALDVSLVMLVESALSFLGLGVQAPMISWGLMAADGQPFMRVAWWLTFFPGLAIFLCAISFNVFSNWLRLALDPAQAWRLEKRAPATLQHNEATAGSMGSADDLDLPRGRLLAVRDLHVTFRTSGSTIHAARGVDISLSRGETLVILGESGSGKSVLTRAILGIIQSPPGSIDRGQVLYNGTDLLSMPASKRRSIRGDRIAMVFQDSLATLNPVFSVGWQIAELFHQHRGLPFSEGYKLAADLLRRVGIPSPDERIHSYAHQMSGGMRQRVMIALAIALKPDILLADEPTTALDVTVQAQIMQLLKELQTETGMALLLVTHDIAVASEVADRIAVMYAGRVVETAPVLTLMNAPAHPYTRALIELALDESAGRQPIGGNPADLSNLPSGCAFHPRCPRAQAICREIDPAYRKLSPQHVSACHFAEEVASHGF
jgi:peptide/nickel transport system permease protein